MRRPAAVGQVLVEEHQVGGQLAGQAPGVGGRVGDPDHLEARRPPRRTTRAAAPPGSRRRRRAPGSHRCSLPSRSRRRSSTPASRASKTAPSRPPPGRRSRTSPPCARAVCRARARPMPCPGAPARVVKPWSKTASACSGTPSPLSATCTSRSAPSASSVDLDPRRARAPSAAARMRVVERFADDGDRVERVRPAGRRARSPRRPPARPLPRTRRRPWRRATPARYGSASPVDPGAGVARRGLDVARRLLVVAVVEEPGQRVQPVGCARGPGRAARRSAPASPPARGRGRPGRYGRAG